MERRLKQKIRNIFKDLHVLSANSTGKICE
jgi:hypothetical protein